MHFSFPKILKEYSKKHFLFIKNKFLINFFKYIYSSLYFVYIYIINKWSSCFDIAVGFTIYIFFSNVNLCTTKLCRINVRELSFNDITGTLFN